MTQNYNPNEWRLYIDSCKYSLKAVLIHNGNIKPYLPIGHVIQYEQDNLKICGNLKVVDMLLGKQGRYTKYSGFCACGAVQPKNIIASRKNGLFEIDLLQEN